MSKKKQSGLEAVSEIIESLKRNSALGRNLEEAQIWQRWPEIAGMDFMPHGRPLGVREGMLIIEVDSAVWMHKFAYIKRDIIHRINRILGEKLVAEIYLTLTPEEKLLDPQDKA